MVFQMYTCLRYLYFFILCNTIQPIQFIYNLPKQLLDVKRYKLNTGSWTPEIDDISNSLFSRCIPNPLQTTIPGFAIIFN